MHIDYPASPPGNVQTEASPTFYVSTTGNDSNPGTFSQPWRTIQKAANSATPGSTVYVRGGVYNERITVNVSGSATGGYITFQNYSDETAVVDGTGLTVPEGMTGLFLIITRSYIIIQGLEIRNFKTTISDRVPVGIHIRGASHHIQIQNNKVHHIEHNGTAASGVDAHGIAVYGTNATQSIDNLVIDGNELYALKLGSSESLVINGNVNGFQITKNKIHDNNNIGIDAIGFEGVSPDPATDQARNGVIAGNIVYNINSYGNPAYGTDRCADGIYVDGGRTITIERNIVHHNNIGIELASEHPGQATSDITARNNFVYLNDIVGIAMGGYDLSRGSTQNCFILNNTLFSNDRLQEGNGEILLQYDTRNCILKNNIFCANTQNLLVTNPFTQNTDNVVDYNIFYAPGGAANSEWQWKNTWYTGFDSYRGGTGNDAHSSFVNPLLTSTSLPDLHLKATSPAVDKGQNLAAAGTLDSDGQSRIWNIIDIGADEVPGLDDLLGTWDGTGVWYRNTETGAWLSMGSPATLVASGDIDGDYVDDLIGVWSSGLWVKYTKTKTWAKLSGNLPTGIASGDMNGDGRDDVVGSFASGVWYRNSATGAWVLMSSSAASLVAAGEIDGDSKDDLIGVWSGGLWVKNSSSEAWTKVSANIPTDIASGDMNGDGRDDVVGSWASGVWYWNSLTGGWVLMSLSAASLVAAGEIDGDSKDDLIGVWTSGFWVKKSKTATWMKITGSLPRDIDAGLFRIADAADAVGFAAPVLIYTDAPGARGGFQDLSNEGPRGWKFSFEQEENLIPFEQEASVVLGPGDPGLQFEVQENLVPREDMEREQEKGNQVRKK